MGAKLILVRHSAPVIDENTPQSSWRLSTEGRAAAAALGERLQNYDAPAIWCSPELKALETAEMIAEALDLPVLQEQRLREHQRTSLGYMRRSELEAGVARLLASDEKLVFGDETARSVFDRMEAFLNEAASSRRDTLAVTHGTALAIFVGRRCGIDPISFWRSLGLPMAIVLDNGHIEAIIR